MNLDQLRNDLTEAGWKNVQRRTARGWEIWDLVGDRKWGLMTWVVMV
jgi:hypothetical protein